MIGSDPRLDHLMPELVAVLGSDLRFFRRRPDRRHRLRLAARAEVQEAAIRVGLKSEIPAGFRAYCGLRQVAPGLTHRVFGYAPEGIETDVSEAEAAQAYAFLTPHNAATLNSLVAPSGAAPSRSHDGGRRG